jgi:hypothetical protein
LLLGASACTQRCAGEETDWSVAYAVSYVRSEVGQTGLLMKVGSDDEAQIYLNGEEVYRFAARRSYVPDQNEVAGVRLKSRALSEHWSNAPGPIRAADAIEKAGVTDSSADRSWPGWSP